MVQPIYYTSVSRSLSAIDDGRRQFEGSCYTRSFSSASYSTSVSTDGSHIIVILQLHRRTMLKDGMILGWRDVRLLVKGYREVRGSDLAPPKQ